jgi:hypothetical protein
MANSIRKTSVRLQAANMPTVIEIRPYRGGWQCFEGPGVQPYWTGEHAKEDAIGYATARAKFGRGEIRVLNRDGKVQTIIPLTTVRKP